MMKLCRTNKIVIVFQSGFRSKLSCFDAIAKLMEIMRRKIDHKETGRVSVVDLSKVYDMLVRKILLIRTLILWFQK